MAKVDYTKLSSELDEILAALQSDDISIDEALRLHGKGLAITAQLQDYLDTAELEIKKVTAIS